MLPVFWFVEMLLKVCNNGITIWWILWQAPLGAAAPFLGTTALVNPDVNYVNDVR